MLGEALHHAKPAFITAHIQGFRETGSLRFLLAAVVLTMRQGRTMELLYGGYCSLFRRPSTVSPAENEAALIALIKQKVGSIYRNVLSIAEVLEQYGSTFKVALLPEDFRSARGESIWQEGEDFLIIGEYGERARLALVTTDSCVISDHYEHVRGVRHIHSVERYGNSGEFLVATGDSRKFLDVWAHQNGRLHFVRRLRSHLAGFTAAVQVNGEYYFGTDFSSRPNYLTTLRGPKCFFPPKAYTMFVTAFFVFFDRYLVSVNNELDVIGRNRTLSVFDTLQQKFIYCDYWAAPAADVAARELTVAGERGVQAKPTSGFLT
jgi:hypothetical protein